MKISVFSLILFAVLLNTGAQLLLKAGMSSIGHFEFTLGKILHTGVQASVNPFILIGLSIYVMSFLVWLLVLSRVDVSLAYPMVSLGYVFNAITAHYLFDENLSMVRISGIVIILLGVYLVARS